MPPILSLFDPDTLSDQLSIHCFPISIIPHTSFICMAPSLIKLALFTPQLDMENPSEVNKKGTQQQSRLLDLCPLVDYNSDTSDTSEAMVILICIPQRYETLLPSGSDHFDLPAIKHQHETITPSNFFGDIVGSRYWNVENHTSPTGV